MIIGSQSNDGNWEVIEVGVNGDYIDVAPSLAGEVILNEDEGSAITIHGDLEVLSNDISFRATQSHLPHINIRK